MGQINTNNYPAVDSLLDADLLIVENATHGTGTTTPKQLRENAIGTDPLQTTAQTVTSAINEIFEMATDTVIGLELGKMTSFSDGVIVTDIDLHREPAEGDRILFYHSSAVASPSSLTTYNDGVAVTKSIMDFSMTHPIGLTLMEFGLLGWTTVQDIAAGGYTAGTGISINGTTISNSAPQLGDDIAYSRIDSVTSGALGYFSADADCLVMDFRTDAEPYNGGYTLRLTTTGASFKYAVLKDKAGNNYAEEIPSGSLVMCKSNVSGTGSEADPVVVTVLEIGNTEMAHDVEVLKDICITEKTVSGNPITVTDALPYAALSLSADIEPIQDLHGQSAPYVGGAGKNKLPLTLANLKALNIDGTWSGNTYTFQGLTFKIDTDNANNITDITVNGTSNALTEFYIYRDLDNSCPFINDILNGCTGGSGDTYMIRISDLATTSANCHNGDSTINITASGKWSCQIHIKAGVTLSNKPFYPMIRLASVSDATFAPYSNICPISGRTEVGVDDLPNADYVPFFEGVKNGTYGFVDLGSLTWEYYSSSSMMQASLTNALSASSGIDAICTRYTNAYASGWSGVGDKQYSIINGNIRIKDTSYTDAATFKTAMSGVYLIYELATPTTPSYTAEQWAALVNSFGGYDVTIQLGQTVYGGTLNVTTGVLTIDRVSDDLGDYTFVYDSGTNSMKCTMSGCKRPSADTVAFNAILSICPVIAAADRTTTSGIRAYMFAFGDIELYIRGSGYTDATQFKTAMSGQTICYELATPTTIQLTPTQLTMLKGYNRLSSDGGGDITLTYKADRLAAIEAALAALQNT